MTIHRLTATPPAWLGEALEHFERQFHYPLGESASFRISHGRDYLPFFQAIGAATVLVAERDGEVLGTLAGIRRPLRLPDGDVQTATYVCDLKLRPAARRGRTLMLLARELEQCWHEAGGGFGYGVVMDGPRRMTPANYTGRCDIPGFVKVGELTILKVAVRADSTVESAFGAATIEEVDAAFQSFTRRGCTTLGGSPHIRSMMAPVPLIARDASACGVVEDTRRGKRLFAGAGVEMRAAHLSRFGFASTECGASLLRAALGIARQSGFSALFACLPRGEAAAFRPLLAELEVLEAPATVYGHGIANSAEWHIHPSEI